MLKTIAYETWKRATLNLRSLYQLRLNIILNHVPKVLIYTQNDRYEFETISSSNDLYKALKLRSNIQEPLTSPSLTDEFDAHADHVMIKDKKKNIIVGGFRIVCSGFHQKFSCETAFDISALKKSGSQVLEMSRLYILPEHKHTDVMYLAARFLSEYSLQSKTEIILSSQSINSGASRHAALVYRYFVSIGARSAEPFCSPRPSHEIPNFQHWNNHFKSNLSNSEIDSGASLLPTVLRESVSMGALIGGTPSIDRATNRIDFLTLLHKEDLNRSLWKKSQLSSGLSIVSSFS